MKTNAKQSRSKSGFPSGYSFNWGLCIIHHHHREETRTLIREAATHSIKASVSGLTTLRFYYTYQLSATACLDGCFQSGQSTPAGLFFEENSHRMNGLAKRLLFRRGGKKGVSAGSNV